MFTPFTPVETFERHFQLVFSARKWSCRKVMFSQASVCPQEGWGKVTSNASRDRLHGRVPSYSDYVGHSLLQKRSGRVPPSLTPDIRPEDPLLVTSGGDHWWLVQNCSFGPLPPKQHLVVTIGTEACTVSKRAVCILLECFLVGMCEAPLCMLHLSISFRHLFIYYRSISDKNTWILFAYFTVYHILHLVCLAC